MVNGTTSEWQNVTSGVPEGAQLAPLLFAMYINDLPSAIKSSECVMFADDVKLFYRVKTASDCSLLQSDLDNLSRWSADWQLKLNPSKCLAFTMTLRTCAVRYQYSICGSTLECVSEVRDLGVVLDTKLTFSAHVSQTICKANRALGILIRSFQTGLPRQKSHKETLLATNFANVRSILEYGCVIWGGAAKSHVMRLERIQHKFLIWLASRASNVTGRSLEYGELMQTFDVPSLESRRLQYDLMFLRNVLRGDIDSPYLLRCFSLHVPARTTRNLSLFYAAYARINTVKFGMFCRIPMSANVFLRKCPTVDIFTFSPFCFKSHIKRYNRARGEGERVHT